MAHSLDEEALDRASEAKWGSHRERRCKGAPQVSEW